MRKSADIFARLLERFKLRESVTDDVQRMILSRRRDALAMTLRAVNDYSVWYGMVLRAYFGARRAGFRVSVGASKTIVVLVAAVLLASLAVTLIHSVHIPDRSGRLSGISKDVHDYNSGVKGGDNNDSQKDLTKKHDDRNLNDNKNLSVKACKLGIAAFTGEENAGEITRVIADALIRLKGPDRVIRLTARGGKAAPRILMGSVGKIGATYIITSRIVDVEKGTVLYSTSESVNSSDETARAGEAIAERIAARIQ